jgi:hypothetical protein
VRQLRGRCKFIANENYGIRGSLWWTNRAGNFHFDFDNG